MEAGTRKKHYPALRAFRVCSIAFFSPPENAPVIDLRSVVISFCFAVVIGLISGLYPAFRASRLDPIEALRYG